MAAIAKMGHLVGVIAQAYQGRPYDGPRAGESHAEMILRMITGEAGLKELVSSADIEVEGSRIALLGLLRLLDPADGNFAIVTP